MHSQAYETNGLSQPVALAPPKRELAGALGTLAALLGGAAAALALWNLAQAAEWVPVQTPGVGVAVPAALRQELLDALLLRVHVFGTVAAVLAVIGETLGVRGRRAPVGVVGMVLAGLVLVASGYSHAMALTHGPVEPDPAAEAAAEGKLATLSPDPLDAAATPIHNPRHGAFLLGQRLGMGVLAAAQGVDTNEIVARAREIAGGLGAKVPEPPIFGGDRAENGADAIHYLLDTAGKPVWQQLSKKHGEKVGALFELGLKLQMLRLLHGDAEMAAGLVESCRRLGDKGGVAKKTMDDGLVDLASGKADDVQLEIDVTETLIEQQLVSR
jgi:hypothetical protein